MTNRNINPYPRGRPKDASPTDRAHMGGLVSLWDDPMQVRKAEKPTRPLKEKPKGYPRPRKSP